MQLLVKQICCHTYPFVCISRPSVFIKVKWHNTVFHASTKLSIYTYVVHW